MHFLLTNDDGIDAPGLAALTAAIQLIPGATFTIVAPKTEQSQCGHRVTTHAPLEVTNVAANRYAVAGTPADCVRVALFGLNLKPDYVVSGVNAGGNMGQDIVISGTIAGAREAAYHGCVAAALSHYLVSGIAVDWSRTSIWAAEILQKLIQQPLGKGRFWNVNFPHHPPGPLPLPDQVTAPPSAEPLLVSYEEQTLSQGQTHFQYNAKYVDRPKPAGSDVATCFGGLVSVSELGVCA